MQIKPIIAAAGAIACMLPGWTAIAAHAPNPSGEISILAMAEDKAEKDPEAKSEKQHMTKTAKPAATVAARNTRPRIDHHKDARACLDAGNNAAIIKCAEKYR